MAFYVRDAVAAALRELAVLQEGETPTAQQGIDGLETLNWLVDDWAANSLQIYTVTRTTATITPSQASYTVGTGGNISMARPMFVDHVNFQDLSTSPDTEHQLNLLTDDLYSVIVQKALTSTLPRAAYFNPTYPLATLTPWPIPTQSQLQWVIYAGTAVTEFAALSDAIALPPGYRRMIVTNLAMEMAASYSVEPSASLVRRAMGSMGSVKRSNSGGSHLSDLTFERAALIQNAPWWSIRIGP